MRDTAIPSHLNFIVHVKHWRMGTSLPAEHRDKVQTIQTQSEQGSLRIGRYNLRLNHVIGLQRHPDATIWRLAASSLAASGPDAAVDGGQLRAFASGNRQIQRMPTLVVHVPSSLNPGYQDASIEFGPATMSWLHKPVPAAPSVERARVVVPLHLARDHPARGFSKRRPIIPSRVPAVAAERWGRRSLRGSKWTDGWLPFPLHNRLRVGEESPSVERTAEARAAADGEVVGEAASEAASEAADEAVTAMPSASECGSM